MKFTDGYWMLRPGFHASYAAQAYEFETTEDTLTVFAPAKAVHQRGDTLNGPLITIEFSSPAPDVIGVKLSHFYGEMDKHPGFPIFHRVRPPVVINIGEDAATLTSGHLSVRIPRAEPLQIEYLCEQSLLTTSGPRGIGLITDEAGNAYIHEQLSLGVGENVYGLGERFTAFIKNSQVVDIWNRDGGTGSEQAYKNIPFYLTNRGYGVFVNHPGLVSFEVASEKTSKVQFSMAGQSLEYFLVYGPAPKEIIEKYTALTGRPALPPAWSFGLWLSTSFTTDYQEETVTSFIQGMADHHIPLHVFHFDCFWMKEFHWCDFQWDGRIFPDPKAMLARLKQRGLHICVWINPYIAQRSRLFAEGLREGYFLKKPGGEVWQTDQWQPGMAIVDFTNPEARKWYGNQLRSLLEMGVDTFKTDFGERIPTGVEYFDSSDPERMHNFYSYLYTQTVFEVIKEHRGEGEALIFARSATAGGQRFPVHWGGDCESTFESMAETLRGGLSLGLCGFGFWSHDIGGFVHAPPAALYKRWVAFGLLSSHSRLHGDHSYRVPWLFDEEAVDVLRFFVETKCRLMPYLYAQSIEACSKGTPLLRAMLLEFPGDPACETLDRQYMLGDSLLVAPVFSADGVVDYYLPPGRWTNFLTGEVVAGPGWKREVHSYLSLPLMARPNSVLAVGTHSDRPDYDYSNGVTLHIYEPEEGKPVSVVIPTVKGEMETTFLVERQEQMVRIIRSGKTKPWQVFLAGRHGIVSVDGGTFESSSGGVNVTPDNGLDRIDIHLESGR